MEDTAKSRKRVRNPTAATSAFEALIEQVQLLRKRRMHLLARLRLVQGQYSDLGTQIAKIRDKCQELDNCNHQIRVDNSRLYQQLQAALPAGAQQAQHPALPLQQAVGIQHKMNLPLPLPQPGLYEPQHSASGMLAGAGYPLGDMAAAGPPPAAAEARCLMPCSTTHLDHTSGSLSPGASSAFVPQPAAVHSTYYNAPSSSLVTAALTCPRGPLAAAATAVTMDAPAVLPPSSATMVSAAAFDQAVAAVGGLPPAAVWRAPIPSPFQYYLDTPAGQTAATHSPSMPADAAAAAGLLTGPSPSNTQCVPRHRRQSSSSSSRSDGFALPGLLRGSPGSSTDSLSSCSLLSSSHTRSTSIAADLDGGSLDSGRVSSCDTLLQCLQPPQHVNSAVQLPQAGLTPTGAPAAVAGPARQLHRSLQLPQHYQNQAREAGLQAAVGDGATATGSYSHNSLTAGDCSTGCYSQNGPSAGDCSMSIQRICRPTPSSSPAVETPAGAATSSSSGRPGCAAAAAEVGLGIKEDSAGCILADMEELAAGMEYAQELALMEATVFGCDWDLFRN